MEGCVIPRELIAKVIHARCEGSTSRVGARIQITITDGLVDKRRSLRIRCTSTIWIPLPFYQLEVLALWIASYSDFAPWRISGLLQCFCESAALIGLFEYVDDAIRHVKIGVLLG